jgi:organic hydroperoxide reductase OsmC/OhrA
MSDRMSHRYETTVTWTGNRGTGTSGYRDFGREHHVTAVGPAMLEGSADPAFSGASGLGVVGVRIG